MVLHPSSTINGPPRHHRLLWTILATVGVVGSRAFRTAPPPPLRLGRPSAPPPQLFATANNNNNMAATLLYEKYRDALPAPQVVEACSGRKVIASDLAAEAGIGLGRARRDLTLLASLSRGDLAVSKDGELIYSFPDNLAGVLAQRSAQYKLQQSFRQVWPTLFWAIRVSFGVALVASLVAIYSAIFFISTSGGSSSEDREERRDNQRGGLGGFGGWNYFWGPSPFDFFFYRPYGYYGYYGADVRRDPEELGFFESVYSYVFGDGDPNQGLEERRLQLAAQMIRANNGAVTAEQLAPYCDPDRYPEEALESNYVDESFVLPIVTQLNGEPTVTEDGDIAYLFPELQTTVSKKTTLASSAPDSNAMILKRAGLEPNASARDIQRMLNYNGISTRAAYQKEDLIRILEKALPPMTAEQRAEMEKEAEYEDPSLLAEREIPFSVATDLNKLLSGGLGVLNLGGALYLGSQLAAVTAAGYSLPGVYGVIAGAYPLLLGYAVLFNVIPLVRNFWIQRENANIAQRNTIRKRWRQALLQSGDSGLTRKLKAAKALGVKQKRLGSSKRDIIYDTASTTVEELGKQKETMDLKAFDKLLDEDGKSNASGSTGAFE